jgi:7-carboxy-7-deazaguanine synthase
MRLAEIFYSIQGEGRLLGMPSVFIRTSGCNLRCRWCDTPYTSWKAGGKEWSLEMILNWIKKYPTRHVVITGGEPFLASELTELTARLEETGAHITIETAATLFKPVSCDLMSLSPKLSNSTPWRKKKGRFATMHEERRVNLPVIQQFMTRYDYQLKFVVERRDDFTEVQEILEKLKNDDASRVLIMAQATTRKQLWEKSRWIVNLCKKHGYRYSPRLHIELFGNRRGT